MSGIDFIQDLGLVMLIAAAAAWLCQRIGLPVVIGYLTAGILIGPHTHTFAVVADAGRIQSLAQIGLVFLIFSIGQGIRLQRIKKVGLPLVLGTALIAIMVLVGVRLLGTTLGWPGQYSLVLAAMLMVSSTAVLGKSLRDANVMHRRFGQTALTVTALDDLVAVVMLTVLVSIIQMGQADPLVVFGTVIRLKAVIITMVIGALLLVPPLLNRLGRGVSSEVRSLVIVGLLLAMALLSAKAGFSAALGAFLLGSIVSTTGRNEQVERVLGGLTEVFAPVFFVAMGMLFDFRLLAEVWPLALGVFFIAIVWRMIAATTALVMVGQPMGDASRAALCLTPIGEFSLIIALTGVQGGLVPPTFYALGIGVCLLTAVTTPLLIRQSGPISGWIERKQPGFLAQAIGFYHEWIESLKQRQRSSLTWKLTAPRLIQVTVAVLFISGFLVFANPIYGFVEKWLGSDRPVANWLPLVFWFVFGLLVLAPLIALWRNVEALAMICAESAALGRPKRSVLQPLFEKLLKGSAAIAIVIWLTALVPYLAFPWWGLLAALVIMSLVFWRQLIRLNSRFEIELQRQMADSPFADGKLQLAGWPKRNGQWKLNLAECVIGENTRAVTRRIAELPLRETFACTIVSIERQGVPIPNPTAATVLYPNDKVLLLGQDANLQRAKAWFDAVVEPDGVHEEKPKLADLSLEHLIVPAGSRHAGKPLGDLALHSLFGVQVVGIERDHRPLASPGRTTSFQAGDELLVLGAPEQINELAFWLAA
jgi:CPA2 family monovalent cation:H+ antiporter-2